MFYVEYTDSDGRKALNLAMCQTIETWKNERDGRSGSYAIKIRHESFTLKTIRFDTEEEMLSTFDNLMNALKTYQAHWMSLYPLHEERNQS